MAEQDGRAGIVEDEARLRGGEADVQREQDAAGQQHAKVGLEQLGGVAAQPGDPITWSDTELVAQCKGEAVAALGERGVGPAHVTVDDPDAVGEQASGAGQEIEGGEGQLHVRPSLREAPTRPSPRAPRAARRGGRS